jgi:hypothetical protein
MCFLTGTGDTLENDRKRLFPDDFCIKSVGHAEEAFALESKEEKIENWEV